MNTDVEVALIAGVVAFVVSLIGVLSSWIALRSQRIDLERQIQNQYTDKLYSLRLKKYPQAFVLTEQIQRRPKPKLIIEDTQLKDVADKLYEWKKGTVSLIISMHSLEKFNALRDALCMGYGEKDKFTNEQVEKIMRARNEFRSSLRNDIGLIYQEDEAVDLHG